MVKLSLTSQAWQALENSGLLKDLAPSTSSTGAVVSLEFSDDNTKELAKRFENLNQSGFFYDTDFIPRNGNDFYLTDEEKSKAIVQWKAEESISKKVSHWSGERVKNFVKYLGVEEATTDQGLKAFERGTPIYFHDADGNPFTTEPNDFQFLPKSVFDEISAALKAAIPAAPPAPDAGPSALLPPIAPTVLPPGATAAIISQGTSAPTRNTSDSGPPAAQPVTPTAPVAPFTPVTITLPGKLEAMEKSGLLADITCEKKEEKGGVTLTFDDESQFFQFATKFKQGQKSISSKGFKLSVSEVATIQRSIDVLYWVDGKPGKPGTFTLGSGGNLNLINALGVDLSLYNKERIDDLKRALKVAFKASLVYTTFWDKDVDAKTKEDFYSIPKAIYDAIIKDNNFDKIKTPKVWATPYGKVELFEEAAPNLRYYSYQPLLMDESGNLNPFINPDPIARRDNKPNFLYEDLKPGVFPIPEDRSPPTPGELETYLSQPGIMKDGVAPTLENLAQSRIQISRDKEGKFYPVLPHFELGECVLDHTERDPTELNLPMTEEQAYALGALMQMPKTEMSREGDVMLCRGSNVHYYLKNPPKIVPTIEALKKLILSSTGEWIDVGNGIQMKKDWSKQLLAQLELLNKEKGSWENFVKWLMNNPVGNLVLQGGVTGVLFSIAMAVVAVIGTAIYLTSPYYRRRKGLAQAHEMFVQEQELKRLQRLEAEKKDYEAARSSLARYTEPMVELALNENKYPPKLGMDDDLRESFRYALQLGKTSFVSVGDGGTGKSAFLEALATEIAKARLLKENAGAKNKDFWKGEAGARMMTEWDIDPDAPLRSLCPPGLEKMELRLLDMQKLVAGTQYRGDLEDRLKDLILALSEDPKFIKVAIEEIADNASAGRSEGGGGVITSLKPAMGNGRVAAIGNAVEEDYDREFGGDAQLKRRLPKQRRKPLPTDVIKKIIYAITKAQLHHLEDFNPEFKAVALKIELDDDARKMVMQKASEFYDQGEPDRSMDLAKRVVTELYLKWLESRQTGTAMAEIVTRPDGPVLVIKEAYVKEYAENFLEHPTIADVRDKISLTIRKLRRENLIHEEDLKLPDTILAKGPTMKWEDYKRRLERILGSLEALKNRLDNKSAGFGPGAGVPSEDEVNDLKEDVIDTVATEGADLTARDPHVGATEIEKKKVARAEKKKVKEQLRELSLLRDPAELGLTGSVNALLDKRAGETWSDYVSRLKRVAAKLEEHKKALEATGRDEETTAKLKEALLDIKRMFADYQGDTEPAQTTDLILEDILYYKMRLDDARKGIKPVDRNAVRVKSRRGGVAALLGSEYAPGSKTPLGYKQHLEAERDRLKGLWETFAGEKEQIQKGEGIRGLLFEALILRRDYLARQKAPKIKGSVDTGATTWETTADQTNEIRQKVAGLNLEALRLDSTLVIQYPELAILPMGHDQLPQEYLDYLKDLVGQFKELIKKVDSRWEAAYREEAERLMAADEWKDRPEVVAYREKEPAQPKAHSPFSPEPEEPAKSVFDELPESVKQKARRNVWGANRKKLPSESVPATVATPPLAPPPAPPPPPQPTIQDTLEELARKAATDAPLSLGEALTLHFAPQTMEGQGAIEEHVQEILQEIAAHSSSSETIATLRAQALSALGNDAAALDTRVTPFTGDPVKEAVAYLKIIVDPKTSLEATDPFVNGMEVVITNLTKNPKTTSLKLREALHVMFGTTEDVVILDVLHDIKGATKDQEILTELYKRAMATLGVRNRKLMEDRIKQWTKTPASQNAPVVSEAMYLMHVIALRQDPLTDRDLQFSLESRCVVLKRLTGNNSRSPSSGGNGGGGGAPKGGTVADPDAAPRSAKGGGEGIGGTQASAQTTVAMQLDGVEMTGVARGIVGGRFDLAWDAVLPDFTPESGPEIVILRFTPENEVVAAELVAGGKTVIFYKMSRDLPAFELARLRGIVLGKIGAEIGLPMEPASVVPSRSRVLDLIRLREEMARAPEEAARREERREVEELRGEVLKFDRDVARRRVERERERRERDVLERK